MRVLVTGCSGNLGAAACAHLIEAGLLVRGIDPVAPDDAPSTSAVVI
ncbi:MAG TPA: hypothetical protein QF604_12040 [Candidatus Latescibacteria bacterium]|nr:hypothetical protein [Candidatus Latescibacterota bacterium]HJN28636.1 hypothetical protein [Candidatus Latescibacterota bacterium]